MRVTVGIDVAKEFHWASAIDDRGAELLSCRVDNEPEAIQARSTSSSGIGSSGL